MIISIRTSSKSFSASLKNCSLYAAGVHAVAFGIGQSKAMAREAPSLGAKALSATILMAVLLSMSSLSHSQVTLAPLLLDVVRGAQRQRHDGQRGILFAGSRESAAVRDEQVLHLMSLAVAVERRLLGIAPHAHRAHFVTRKSSRLLARIQEHLPVEMPANFPHALHGVPPEGEIVVAEAKVDDGDGDAVGVLAIRVDRNAILRPRHDLAERAHHEIAGLHAPHPGLEIRAIAGNPRRVARIHVGGKVHLKIPAAHVVGLSRKVVVARDESVIRSSVLIRWLQALEFLEVELDAAAQVPVEIAAHDAARVRESVRVLRG